MAGRWDDKANLKFISLYEKNLCLWKTDSPAYKNRDVRERAINRMVASMAIPDFRNLECKNKIKNVRSHYIQELKKIEKSRGHSPKGLPTYEPKLTWFAPLDNFLRPHILALRKAGGGDGEEELPTAANDATTPWPDSPPEDTDKMHPAVVNPLPANTTSNSNRFVFAEGERETDRKPNQMMGLAGGAQEVISHPGLDLIIESQTVNVTAGQKDSEFEAFGRSIAAQLKNMPFSVALQLQLKIQTLVTEERLTMLRGPPD
ncbi:uncharacterized protein [Hetaerina americana]|uniref:uncharacterized protein n=1 Tax=Hetaerina americana TaxID=62018 RepID=UPI003A7F1876